jgi:hypothetical protein
MFLMKCLVDKLIKQNFWYWANIQSIHQHTSENISSKMLTTLIPAPENMSKNILMTLISYDKLLTKWLRHSSDYFDPVATWLFVAAGSNICIKPHIGYRLLIWILNEGHFSSDSVNDVVIVKNEKNIWISLINFKIWLTRKGIKRWQYYWRDSLLYTKYTYFKL